MMKSDFDMTALPAAQRIQCRVQAMNYRAECLLGWQACYRQVRRTAEWHGVLTPEAIAQAHTAHVVLGVVGQPVWSN